MGDIMRPIPFEELLTRIFDEYQQQRSIFGIPEQQFYSPVKGKTVSVFGETCATPVGPAAGPHTQLAQNIVTSWLTGGRFIELKTVQILDRLELEKPCIDAEDECFNTEWSTELPCLKPGMNTSKPGLPCTFSKRCSNLLIPVNRSSLI